MQWGVVTEEVTATLFPVAFMVACASVVMTAVSKSDEGGWTSPINTQNITTTSFALRIECYIPTAILLLETNKLVRYH